MFEKVYATNKKNIKKSDFVLGALFPYLFIYFVSLFYISYENKNTRQTVLFAELAFTFSGIVPNDLFFVCLLACLFG